MPFKASLLTVPAQTFQTGKAICVGRNYAAHAAELNNPVPTEPLLFIKPGSALQSLTNRITLSDLGPVHYETELTVLISKPMHQASPEESIAAISGIGLGLDLTLRELQSELKSQGHPWEKSKAFDGSGVISPFLPPPAAGELARQEFTLHINDELRQHGLSSQMLTPIPELISYISNFFSLEPGDIVFTGTPQGVGVLEPGSSLGLSLGDYSFEPCLVSG